MLKINYHPEVANALKTKRASVALESTLIAHGLPWPINFETAKAAEEAIRQQGAVPATIAIWQGKPTIGLTLEQIESLAQNEEAIKTSRRDLAWAITQGRTAATTVAATMTLAHLAGISVFATGGIGGVHRGVEQTGDISADLTALSSIPIAVVCAGAKSILDLPRTLEMLETLSVPVIGYQTDDFPAFYLSESGLPVSGRADTADEIATIIQTHGELSNSGMVIAQPIADDVALEPGEWSEALNIAEKEASEKSIKGKDVTPFLLSRLAEITNGKTLRANQSLIVANAHLAAQIALALHSNTG